MKELFVKNGDFLHKIELNEVYFFTKMKGKIIAVLENKKVPIATTSLYQLNELLGSNKNFFRCHKSFIINIRKIEKISKYSSRTYNIMFRGIPEQAYITNDNVKLLKERIIVI